MSLITDALLKAERDRTDAAVADAARFPPLARAGDLQDKKRRRSLAPLLVNATMVAGVIAVLIMTLLRQRTPEAIPAENPDPAPVALVDRPAPEFNAPPPSAASPFSPETIEPTELTPPHLSSPDYTLAGMSVLGDDTLISVLRHSDQRSIWIPVGRSAGGIAAVSYDAEHDRAVIRIDEQLLTIRMGAGTPPSHPAE